jgi:CRISPR-associated protein Csx10
MRLYYQLTTIDPIIVSQTSATTNNHECLDYIPGSAILGALASQHYTDLSAEQSWQAFHTSGCRFSPCYAVKDQQASLPVPASWHFAKGKTLTENNKKIAKDVVTNHAHSDFKREPTTQYKQWRDAYITASGFQAEVTKGLSTKTAIDTTKGSAKKSMLFSYSYLDAKQNFIGWIDCPDEQLRLKFEKSLNGSFTK